MLVLKPPVSEWEMVLTGDVTREAVVWVCGSRVVGGMLTQASHCLLLSARVTVQHSGAFHRVPFG